MVSEKIHGDLHNNRIALESSPLRLEDAHKFLFSTAAKEFLIKFVENFEQRVSEILLNRDARKIEIARGQWKPEFKNINTHKWSINQLPARLQNRKIDLGDVSPSDTQKFIDALYTNVQGIQVDFDDGHCTTWRNTVQGLYNVSMFVHGRLQAAPTDIGECPVLMLRPRAFNMIEHHCMINGKEVIAPLFDFALLMFHNGQKMYQKGIGPYLYLSKIEDPKEAQLWNDMFIWTQRELGIPLGTIKACILIENILAAYSMEDILYEIREHAIGLNCGIWDYCASIIAKFADNPNFLIPDRRKYVNMSKDFLKAYMKLVVSTCHRHNALATGGMIADILPPGKGTCDRSKQIINEAMKKKAAEIEIGVDGFLIYDERIATNMQSLWDSYDIEINQINIMPNMNDITAMSLLNIPKGGVTMDGLRHNIAVSMLFIYHWLTGKGVFYYKGTVEDSATAEISRSQLWQWIRYKPLLEDQTDDRKVHVTRSLVYKEMNAITQEFLATICISNANKKVMVSSKFILLEIISSRNFIDFITTYLNDNHKFRALHNKSEGLVSKL